MTSSVALSKHDKSIIPLDVAELVVAYKKISHKQMRDMPFYNPELDVEAIGFDDYLGDTLGVMISPWFLNLVLLPHTDNKRAQVSQISVGEKIALAMPSGKFDFIKADIEDVGSFLTCSLLSPVFELTSQNLAQETAEASLEVILTYPESEHEQQAESQALSRRDIITGMRAKVKARNKTSDVWSQQSS
ncbi:MAG: [NiFe]-hydrogenase assembly chaperone HybE [Glaciecola sp.]|jgi:[NiFe] hydrogenase assembly HybE family chaperone